MVTLKGLESADLYTVGWIAALVIERAAAIAMLDERHDQPSTFTQHPADSNVYTWGKMGKHNIVIASLPVGVYGTVSAATTAMSMLSSLPQIKISLLVGIGGGISRPTEGRDIRLGDIVVSQPQGTTGGVVQYDLGKARSHDKWERTGFLAMPPRVLLNALGSLQAEHELEDSRVPELLRGMQKLKRGPGGYSYQGSENDRLFKAPYNHIDGHNCRTCDENEIVVREKRDTTDPVVHYGTIASGNCLVKDAVTRDRILEDLDGDCICFEMEAAGLMNHFPCLVIRGICDYADSHKNDQWQRYASIVSAAYGKELLGYVPTSGLQESQRAVDLLKSMDYDIQAIQAVVSDTQAGVENLETDSHLRKIKEWLSAPDPSTNLIEALQKRQEGTGVWFLQGQQFQEWEGSVSGCLWLHGIPGCGKTILAATILERLNRNLEPTHVLLYFFFDFSDAHKQPLNKLVRSLIIQLYSQCVKSRAELDRVFSTCQHGTRQPTDGVLSDTFRHMLNSVDNVQIVIDALDECRTRKELMQWIEHLMIVEHTGLRLLITSRKEEEIESALTRWMRPHNIFSIQQDPVNRDIGAYVYQQLRNDRGFQRWCSKPDVLDEIETKLNEEAGGMFRWAVCQLDILRDCLDLRRLRNSLNSLPRTLEETYDRILASIDESYRLEAIRLLQFLTYSERPLTLQEAIDIMVVDPGNDPEFDSAFRMPEGREITRVCSSLVSLVTREDGDTENAVMELQLAHFSVQQYLRCDRIAATFPQSASKVGLVYQNCMEETFARGLMTRVCLAYLSQLDDDGRTVEEIKADFPLSQYSAQYWFDHAKRSESRDDVQESIMGFLLRRKGAYMVWGKLFDPDQPWNGTLWWPTKEMVNPLYYAALTGLQHTVSLLLKEGANVNEPGGAYHSALQAASSIGNSVIVQLLLDQGADVNMQGGLYGHPLQAASIRGHEKVVQQLLARGAKIKLEGGLYTDALYAASAEGHVNVVRILVEHGADVNTRGGIHVNALQETPLQDHKDILQQLLARTAKVSLQNGLDSNALALSSGEGRKTQNSFKEKLKAIAEDSFYGNALHVASIGNRSEMMKIVDAARIDSYYIGASLGSHDGSTLLAVASFKGHIEVARSLVDQGADITAAAKDGATPLSMASHEGQVEVVKFLLENGADVNTKTRGGFGPLTLASMNGHLELVRFLLENHADINNKTSRGWGAVELAVNNGHAEIVTLLLENGADINTETTDGWGPLMLASMNGHLELVMLLLQNHADIKTKRTDGWGSLLVAAQNGHAEIVTLLLENGADINTETTDGWGPLMLAVSDGHVETIKLLLAKGADINITNNSGCTPLHLAFAGGDTEVADLLLSQAADFTISDDNGWTPMMLASYNGNLRGVEQILEKGATLADINVRSKYGTTPLYLACGMGHTEVVRVLLENDAYINSGNDDSWTPLAVALWESHSETVDLLCQNGAYEYSYARHRRSPHVYLGC
ncbi:hypothetical protein N7501_011817 [Penicillium viridicatum]|nr:hypothetical protein N7501_011817 [Penicillium viridicatum]